MTSLEDIIKTSQFITIEGKRNSGKSTFIFYSLIEILKSNMTVFSPIEDTLFERKLKIIKKNFEIFQNLTSRLKFFFLEENWLQIKQLYGFDYFREEMEKLIKESSTNIIYFHRFGEFFELQDIKEIEPTLSYIMKTAQKENKKLIFSINTQSPVYKTIGATLKDFSDITLAIKELSLNERIIEVQTSVTPLFHNKYYFLSSKNILALMPYNENEIKMLKDKVKILLISKNRELQKFFQYLFQNEHSIDFNIMETMPTLYTKIIPDIDLLLFNDENEKLKIEIPQFIKMNNLKTKIFFLSNKDYFREIDKQILYSQGYTAVFSKNFAFEELIFAMEKESGKFFYFDKFDKIVKNKTLYEGINRVIYENKDDFFRKIKLFVENSIYFTIFVYELSLDTDFNLINLKEIIRDYDSIYIDKKSGQIILLCINSRPRIKKIVEKRFKKQNIQVKSIKIIEAQDIKI